MQKYTDNINISEGNPELIKSVIDFLRKVISQTDDGIYKENLKLLIEILGTYNTRINYTNIKSLYIIYSFIDVIKNVKNINEESIDYLINNLNNYLLEEESGVDTEFESQIIELIDEKEYIICEDCRLVYKSKINDILNYILVHSSYSNDSLIDIKKVLEEKLAENIGKLLNSLIDNPIYIAREEFLQKTENI